MINKEEKTVYRSVGAIGAVGCIIMLFLSPICAAVCAVICISVCLIFRRYNKSRLSETEKLNDYLSKVCSGNYSLDISENSEGELSILKNNIYKVVIILKSTNEELQRDKAFLASSLTDISHQLKTPLTSMMMMSDIMKNEPDKEKQKEFFEIIEAQLDKMKWLITTLLKISKLDAGTVEFSSSEISVGEVLDESLKPFSIMLDIKNISVEREGEDFVFRGDKSWTVEAIENIIKNCIEHLPDGGKLYFSSKETSIFGELIIRDNGCGIDEEDLPHIFERFYHGKNASSESVGIGLALSDEILRKENARIEAESKPGTGTLFRIKFYKSVV